MPSSLVMISISQVSSPRSAAMNLAESQWVTEVAEHKIGNHFGQLCLGQDRTHWTLS